MGGEIYVPKIPSMKILDVAAAIAPKAKIRYIGIRPGEKLHELMIGEDDARSTFEYDRYFKILPMIYDWNHCPHRIAGGKRCADGFSYTSANNHEWMTRNELQSWMRRQANEFSSKNEE